MANKKSKKVSKKTSKKVSKTTKKEQGRKTITLSDVELHAKLDALKTKVGASGWNELFEMLYNQTSERETEYSGKQFVENFILECLAHEMPRLKRDGSGKLEAPEKITVQRVYLARKVNRNTIKDIFGKYQEKIDAYNAKVPSLAAKFKTQIEDYNEAL